MLVFEAGLCKLVGDLLTYMLSDLACHVSTMCGMSNRTLLHCGLDIQVWVMVTKTGLSLLCLEIYLAQ